MKLRLSVNCRFFFAAMIFVVLWGILCVTFAEGAVVDRNLPLIEEPNGAEQRGYVENEIIVKFRGDVAEKMERKLAKGASAGELGLSDSLDELNSKYRLRKAEPLFKDFKKRREQVKALLEKDARDLSKKEKRILARLKRAPKGAKVPELGGIYKLAFSLEAGQSVEDVAEAYNRDAGVEYAELNYIVSIHLTPNDTHYPLQWPLNNTGQIYPESGRFNHPPGIPDSDIDAPEAWNINTGSSEVIVAVVDTGVDYEHRDLRNNMWINEAELNGMAEVDDDGNGYIDDIYGYNFAYRNSDPKDDDGHGTHCSGIIAAEGNNGLDISGVCWDARIMALKFLNWMGMGTIDDAVVAFYYAVENGADVISNSWGANFYLRAMREAVDYAHSQGVVIAASAGNGDSDDPMYPAGYGHVISVAATNSRDEKAPFSNYGDWVDIAAPGVDVLSLRAEWTAMGMVYDSYTTIASGTSMSCPHIAGACGLLLSTNPMLGNEDIYDILMGTVDSISPGICLSDGRVNVFKAVQSAILPEGRLHLDRDFYACFDVLSILLSDSHLAGQGGQEVTVTTSGGDTETVFLSERAPAIGLFGGTVSAEGGEPNIGDGTLQLSDGEVITATYYDADDGTGNPAVAEDTAEADCEGPVITNVRIDRFGPEPEVTFETNEPSRAVVFCGLDCGEPNDIIASDSMLATNHSIKLGGVLPSTDYFFVIEATDALGNVTVDDNNNVCYVFTTDEGPGDIDVPGDYNSIQEAINHCWEGGTVWVADGRYKGPGNRDIDFKGKVITVRSENGPVHCIIDANGEEGPRRGFYFHNSEDANSVLDGFTITNGNASKGGSFGSGGAIRCTGSSPTVTNSIFSRNRGDSMSNTEGSNPMVTGCTFLGHNIDQISVGMQNDSSSPMVINCTFMGHIGSGRWGGGGMENRHGSSATVVNCWFVGNIVGTYGGGMFNYVNSNSTVVNCVFSGNRAGLSDPSDDGYGGGMANFSSNPVLINCTFSNNWANDDGGGMANIFISGPRLSNCVFWGNIDSGGVDESAQIHRGTVKPVVNYSCVQGWSGTFGGVGNIGANPLFVDADGLDNIIGTKDDNVQLPAGSPCIDAGDNTAVPAFVSSGVDGWPRFVDDPNTIDIGNGTAPVVDMGAYEYQGPRELYVDDDAPDDPGPGDAEVSDRLENGTEAHPFDSIQEAIDFAQDGDTIIVAEGIYYEHINFRGKRLMVRSTELTKPPVVASTIIDGGGIGRVVTFSSGEGSGSILWGFTITGGEVGIYCYAASPTIINCSITGNAEAAMDLWHRSEPTIIDCKIDGDVISHSIVENLRTGKLYDYIQDAIDEAVSGDEIVAGEGVYWENIDFEGKNLTVRSTNPNDLGVVTATIIKGTGNGSVVRFAGGEGSGAVLSGFTISGSGIGVYCYGTSPTIRNCTVIGGAGIAMDLWHRSAPTTINCNIIGIVAVHPTAENLRTGAIFDYIQDAINAAVSGDEIVADEGNYFEDIDFKGKNLRVRSKYPDDAEVVRSTVIKGGIDNYVVRFANGEGPGAVLSGFTIIGKDKCIYCFGTFPTITKCTIVGNGGVAIELWFCSNPAIIDCTIIGEIKVGKIENLTKGKRYYISLQNAINDASSGDEILVGEGTYRENIRFKGKNILVRSRDWNDPKVVASTVLDGCGIDSVVKFSGGEGPGAILTGFTITGGNRYDGGGIRSTASTPTISNCVIAGNTGSGIYCEQEGPTIINCIISGNSGSGIRAIGRESATIINCTIVGNGAKGVDSYRGKPQVINCIVWSNRDSEVYGVPFLTYSDVEGGWPGEGNIDSDPHFVEPGYWGDVNDPHIRVEPNNPDAIWIEGDYHLLPDSGCVDAGIDMGVFEDIEGNVRPFDYPDVDNNGELEEFDIGAYEVVTPSIEVEMRITPRALNTGGRGGVLKADLELPSEFGIDDIDTSSPAKLWPFGVMSNNIKVLAGKKGSPIRVEIAFLRSDIYGALGDFRPDELKVGWLTVGKYFYGTDTVKIIR